MKPKTRHSFRVCFLALLILITLNACGKPEDELIGTWAMVTNPDYKIYFTDDGYFRTDGNSEYPYAVGTGAIKITYPGGEEHVFSYSIEDDILNFGNDEGVYFEFKKVQ